MTGHVSRDVLSKTMPKPADDIMVFVCGCVSRSKPGLVSVCSRCSSVFWLEESRRHRLICNLNDILAQPARHDERRQWQQGARLLPGVRLCVCVAWWAAATPVAVALDAVLLSPLRLSKTLHDSEGSRA